MATTRRSFTQRPEDTLEVARRLNQIGGRYLLAATFGNVHGVYKPGYVKLRPKVLKECQDEVVKEYCENDPSLE